MKRIGFVLLAGATLQACGSSNPVTPTNSATPGSATASAYISAVISLMHDNSINRLKIDWTSFTSQVTQRASGARTIIDTYPAISLALGLLNDHHSFFVPPPGIQVTVTNPSAHGCTAPLNAGTPIVPQDIGYVKVGSCCPTGGELTFADAIQQAIRAADRSDLTGWIVDVRGNGGGNMWPMVAGVGPVLGEGVLGFFVPPSGPLTAWTYQNGVAFSGSFPTGHTTTAYTLLRPSPRVAVLTDSRVASSGEAVVVAFRARPNTRSFGTATCGLSTANSSFTLSDGAMLVLTDAVDADRTQTTYGDVIVPDETIVGDAEVAARAIAWLRGS